MTRRQYAGGAARTTITSPIASSGGGTVTLATVTGWPDGSIGKFHIVIDPGLSSEEKILADSLVATVLSFSSGGRGADGTVATSHSPGATVWLCYTALDADEANAHINSVATAHTAAQISFAPAGGIAATTVQAAIAELESEAGDARLDIIEADNWVTQPRMGDASVGTAELIDANVTTAKIADTNVTTAKIADLNVTPAKLAASLPRGYISHVMQTTTQNGIGTTLTDLNTLTFTFTAEASRRYRIHAHAYVVIAASAASCKIAILEGATIVGSGLTALTGAGFSSLEAFAIRVPGAGSVTYKVQMSCNAGTVNAPCSATEPMFILVEDIGV